MSVLDLTPLEGSITFNLAEILDVFQQIDSILSGTSSSFGFTAKGDDGANQTITNGNTFYIKGGNGIGTTGEATDTVRAFVDLSPNPGNSLSFDSNGKLFGTDTFGTGGGGETIISYEPKKLYSDAGHGFGSAGQIKLISADFSLADGTDVNKTADYVIQIVNADSYYLLADGFHTVLAHGLDIGVWYALSNSTPGGYEISYLLEPEELKQNAFIAVDTNTILVSLQEAELGRVVPTATKITQTAHGFSVGNLVSHDGTEYVDGEAGEFCHYVKEVIDTNNFIISRPWSGAWSGVLVGKTYAIDPGSPGEIVDLGTLDPAVDPITVVGYCSKAGYLLGFTEYPLICCGSGGGGDPDPGADWTLVFKESYEGGAHENTYSDYFGFASSKVAYINDTDRATDGDYHLTYTTSSGDSDFLTYYANDALTPGERFKVVADVCVKNLIEQSLNPLFHFMEESGGSQAGCRISVNYLTGSGGFTVRYSNYPAGDVDSSDIPSSQTIVAEKWYRVTLDAKMSSGMGVADGQIIWKVEELEGNETVSTNRTVVATTIAERTISSIVTHVSNSPSGFNHFKGSGGYVSRAAVATGDWGFAYDNINVYEYTP